MARKLKLAELISLSGSKLQIMIDRIEAWKLHAQTALAAIIRYFVVHISPPRFRPIKRLMWDLGYAMDAVIWLFATGFQTHISDLTSSFPGGHSPEFSLFILRKSIIHPFGSVTVSFANSRSRSVSK